MSSAFFCDRCGRAFPWNTKKRIFSRGFAWKCGDNEVKDICDDCLDDLREFMNDGNKNRTEIPGKEGNAGKV